MLDMLNNPIKVGDRVKFYDRENKVYSHVCRITEIKTDPNRVIIADDYGSAEVYPKEIMKVVTE